MGSVSSQASRLSPPCPWWDALLLFFMNISKPTVMIHRPLLKSIHQTMSGTSRHKACNHCREKKIRCDGGQPCQRCRAGGDVCDYSAQTKPTKLDLTQALEAFNDRLCKFVDLGIYIQRWTVPVHRNEPQLMSFQSKLSLPSPHSKMYLQDRFPDSRQLPLISSTWRYGRNHWESNRRRRTATQHHIQVTDQRRLRPWTSSPLGTLPMLASILRFQIRTSLPRTSRWPPRVRARPPQVYHS